VKPASAIIELEGQPGSADLATIAGAGFTVEGAEVQADPADADLVRVRRRGVGTSLPADT